MGDASPPQRTYGTAAGRCRCALPGLSESEPETPPSSGPPRRRKIPAMTPVSPFLTRSAIGLVAGIAVATLFVAVAPGTYFDTMEWRLADLPGAGGNAQGAVTPVRIVTDRLTSRTASWTTRKSGLRDDVFSVGWGLI